MVHSGYLTENNPLILRVKLMFLFLFFVSSIDSSSNNDMWVGMVNSNFEYLDVTFDDTMFASKLTWADGTLADADTTSHMRVLLIQ